MNGETQETIVEESQPEVKPVEEVETVETTKSRSNFKKWLKGDNKKDYVENLSFLIIVASGVLISIGLGLGSFIYGTILLAILGSLFIMVGIIIYIMAQFKGVE